jgi:sensor histidine kinase YesM
MVYFVFFVVNTVAAILYDFYDGFGAIRAMTLYGSVLAVLGIVPFYGFVKQRAYAPLWLWKLVVAIYMLLSVVSLGIITFVILETLSLDAVFGLGVLIAYFGPYLYAIYQYAFKSPMIWKTPPKLGVH